MPCSNSLENLKIFWHWTVTYSSVRGFSTGISSITGISVWKEEKKQKHWKNDWSFHSPVNCVNFFAGPANIQLTSFHEYKAADVGDNEFLRRPGVTPSTCVIGLSISSSLSTSKSPSSSSRPGLEEVDSSLPPVVVLLTSLEGWPYDIRFRRQKRSADKKKKLSRSDGTSLIRLTSKLGTYSEFQIRRS